MFGARNMSMIDASILLKTLFSVNVSHFFETYTFSKSHEITLQALRPVTSSLALLSLKMIEYRNDCVPLPKCVFLRKLIGSNLLKLMINHIPKLSEHVEAFFDDRIILTIDV